MTDDCHYGNIATKDRLPDDTSVDRAAVTAGRTLTERQTGTALRGTTTVDDHGHNDEDFDSNLSCDLRKDDNDHTRQHMGGFPPLRSRGREDNHSTGSSEKENQRDRDREELSRPDHVSERSSYSRRSVYNGQKEG